MKRTPEQEAARKERRRREATYNRCASCNNVAGVGQTHCGACRSVIEAENEQLSQFCEIQDCARNGDFTTAIMLIVKYLESSRHG